MAISVRERLPAGDVDADAANFAVRIAIRMHGKDAVAHGREQAKGIRGEQGARRDQIYGNDCGGVHSMRSWRSRPSAPDVSTITRWQATCERFDVTALT